MKRLLTILGCVMAVGVCASFGGWQHAPKGYTTYEEGMPSPATLWMRDSDKNAMPVRTTDILIFDETYRLAGTGTGTNFTFSFGFWEVDSSGDFQPIAGDLTLYTHRMHQQTMHDVEWEVDSVGDFMPKE